MAITPICGTTTTQGIESQSFTIKGTSKAFRVLTQNLYSNKEQSVVREICANAYDSHVMAGKAGVPFKVTLPTDWDPNFTVEDYGVGLSLDEAIKLFSTVFESTKEETNEQVGAFGLGSKSPFAIADSFSVECVKDGMLCKLLIFKGDDGMPQISTIAHTSTDKDNGVKVVVAVSAINHNRFNGEAARALVAFKPAPICNKELDSIWNHVKYETDDFMVIDGGVSSGSTYVLNGPVLYRLDSTYQLQHPQLNYGYSLVVKTNIGELSIPPNREGIDTTGNNILILQRNIDNFVEHNKECLKQWVDTQLTNMTPLQLMRGVIDNKITLPPTTTWFNQSISEAIDEASDGGLTTAIGTIQEKLRRGFYPSSLRVCNNIEECSYIVLMDTHYSTPKRQSQVEYMMDVVGWGRPALFGVRGVHNTNAKQLKQYVAGRAAKLQGTINRIGGEDTIKVIPWSVLNREYNKRIIKTKSVRTTLSIPVYHYGELRRLTVAKEDADTAALLQERIGKCITVPTVRGYKDDARCLELMADVLGMKIVAGASKALIEFMVENGVVVVAVGDAERLIRDEIKTPEFIKYVTARSIIRDTINREYRREYRCGIPDDSFSWWHQIMDVVAKGNLMYRDLYSLCNSVHAYRVDGNIEIDADTLSRATNNVRAAIRLLDIIDIAPASTEGAIYEAVQKCMDDAESSLGGYFE